MKKLNNYDMINKLSKGIPKEYLITLPKCDCFLQY